jgi:hypothetical protein
MKKTGKTLEETIRELRKRYQNVPSPLSENYNHANKNVNFIPSKPNPQNFKDSLLGDFKPNSPSRFY